MASTALASPPPSFLQPPPRGALDYLESQLSHIGCVGDLAHWERRYAYRERVQETVYSLDTAIVDIQLKQAGKFGFKPGRSFVDGPLIEPDDRRYRVVIGSYDLLRHELKIEVCGPNVR